MIAESSDQKMLFKEVDTIAHKKSETVLPDQSSSEELANHFGDIFTETIQKIRVNLPSASSNHHVPLDHVMILTHHHHWTHSSLSLLMK